MTIIQLHTHDRLLFQKSDAAIVAGDRESVHLLIEKDQSWDGYQLLAVFWRDGRYDSAQSIPLCEAGCCLVPAAILTHSGTLHVALLGRDASGKTKCTSAIRFYIRPGLPTGEGAVLTDISDASATPDHVLAGVTFYAGEKEVQVGAIPTYREGEILSDEVVDLLTVTADFSAGDMTVRAEEDAPMRAVQIQKPDTLEAGNIAYGVRIAGVEGALRALPAVGEKDNGKILTVEDGQWTASDLPTELPAVSDSDNGKVLAVVEGQWHPQEAKAGAESWDELTNKPFGIVPAKTVLFEGAPALTESLDDGEGIVTYTYRAAQNFYLLPPANTILGADFGENSYIGHISRVGTDFAHAIISGADLTLTFDGYHITMETSRAQMPNIKIYLNTDVTVKLPAKYLPDAEKELPAVSAADNGKVLSVVNGAWTATEPASDEENESPAEGGGGGNFTIPVHDLSAMGLPTVEIGNMNGAFAETDTSQLMQDLANGMVTLKINLAMGGETIGAVKTCGGIVLNEVGMATITNIDSFGEMMVYSMIMLQDGFIGAVAYQLDSMITSMIDAYMEDALGGDY